VWVHAGKVVVVFVVVVVIVWVHASKVVVVVVTVHAGKVDVVVIVTMRVHASKVVVVDVTVWVHAGKVVVVAFVAVVCVHITIIILLFMYRPPLMALSTYRDFPVVVLSPAHLCLYPLFQCME